MSTAPKVSEMRNGGDLARMLFSLQRFQLLALFANTATEKTISESYAFAWSRGIYPVLNESAPWHKPYGACFDVGPERMTDLVGWLRAQSESRTPVSFFQIEDHYGIRGAHRPGPHWTQASLINAVRYLFLHGSFDAAFWDVVLANRQSPMEAEAIVRPFAAEEIRFE